MGKIRVIWDRKEDSPKAPPDFPDCKKLAFSDKKQLDLAGIEPAAYGS